jgi:hypothetical protein
MRRREFIAGIGAAAALASRSARAQQTRRLPVIAIVYSVGTVNEMAGTDALGAVRPAFDPQRTPAACEKLRTRPLFAPPVMLN